MTSIKPSLLQRNFWMKWPLEKRAAFRARADWLLKARPAQLTPPGEWRIWLVKAGRGWGKSRVGAEDAAYFGLWNDGVRQAVIAPTHADARDVCVEGDSGLLKVIPPECVETWNRSMGELILKNGSRFKLFSADEPERLRGPQFHRVWADELAAWKTGAAFDQIMLGLRLGKSPRLVITTTPKPSLLLKDLVARSDVFLTHGKSEENAANLAPGVLESLRGIYEGTRWGRQELDGEIVEEVEGALWQMDSLEAQRIKEAPELERIVIAMDPAVTATARSDETGIVAAGRGKDGKIYVLADASGKFSPDGWARRVAALFQECDADLIVGEVNEGGDLIERMLRMVDASLPFKGVRAVKSKAARAWPVSMLYEQGQVHHVGHFRKLEDQMCLFNGEDGLAKGSPDRVDALVWAISELDKSTRCEPRVRLI
jgi:phage terminase large subunit-like protein